MVFGIDGVAFSVFLLCALLVGSLVYEVYTTHRNKVQITAVLKNEAYFHSLLIGLPFKNDPWMIGDKKLYADAKYIVILKRGDEPIAALGFDFSRRALRVRQMQGFSGVNMKGVELGPFLIPIAEKVARALKKEILWIEAAERNFYYTRSSLETKEKYPELVRHRSRMLALYNDVPLRMGFVANTRNTNYLLGHYKVLRKRKSLKRWLKLQANLFNRELRNMQSPLSFDDMP